MAFLLLPAAGFAGDRACPADFGALVLSAFPAARADGEGFSLDGQRIAPPGHPYGVICRRWPAHPEWLLVAVPLIDETPDPAGHDATGDLEVMILEADNAAPLARLTLPQFVREDAIALQELAFDTARYRLVNGRLAFGIRARTGNNSGPNPFSQTRLWLFDPQGDGLVPVLEGMVVAQSSGEWDMQCAGTFMTLSRLIILTGTATNDGTDLRVTTTMTNVISQAQGANCEETRTPQRESEMLYFDGSRYLLSPALRGEG